MKERNINKKIYIIVAMAVVLLLSLFAILNKDEKEDNNILVDLGYNLAITSMGAYSGQYYENGSNETVEDILAIKVTNNGETTVQYCEIFLSGGNEKASFSLSTLKPNESVIVLESTKKRHDTGIYNNGYAYNVAFFKEEPSLLKDTFKIEELNGFLNVKNISDKDITSDVYVYYKNYIDNTYYGGITYRAKVEGGIKAGELKQIVAGHYSPQYSKIMFIDILGN